MARRSPAPSYRNSLICSRSRKPTLLAGTWVGPSRGIQNSFVVRRIGQRRKSGAVRNTPHDIAYVRTFDVGGPSWYLSLCCGTDHRLLWSVVLAHWVKRGRNDRRQKPIVCPTSDRM